MPMIHESSPSYTTYAKNLCPSWCQESHEQPADPGDSETVPHEGIVATAEVAGDVSSDPGRRLFTVRALRFDYPDGTSEGPTLSCEGQPFFATPADTVKVALAMVTAAEVVREAEAANTGSDDDA